MKLFQFLKPSFGKMIVLLLLLIPSIGVCFLPVFLFVLEYVTKCLVYLFGGTFLLIYTILISLPFISLIAILPYYLIACLIVFIWNMEKFKVILAKNKKN